MINIGLRAQIIFAKAEVKAMLSSKHNSVEVSQKGAIVNWSSIMGHVAMSGEAAPYIIAKFGINGLTKSMACSYGSQGIRTNAVAPG